MDHRFGYDDSLSRLQLARHNFRAYPGARGAGRSFSNGRGSLVAHLTQDNGAAVGAGHDQRLFLGCRPCHARALDGIDAIQSKHGGGFNDDLEHVAKRQDSGCRRIGRDANSIVRAIAFGRAAPVLSQKKFLPVIGPRP